ncbi:MAG: hypothetical protein K9M75_05055 [Phycisphaerae bacterium]|nr:hypothetical protein [Phycisphaerae bacterium]
MFNFRFQSNPLTRATASAAGMVFIVGMMLIGFAFLVFVLKDLFALLAAMIFIMAGVGTIGFSLKLFLASRRFGSMSSSHAEYRENVRIHQSDVGSDEFMNF